jgi:hypothetical protein
MTCQKPTIVPIAEEPITIAKPGEFSLDKFKSKRAATIVGVETLLTALPVHNMKEANDYVRLHPNEAEYWSPEFCFVTVPIKGQKRDTLHLIDEELAMRYLPGGRIQRYRLALATKPHDRFFLCQVPSQNLDNSWNATSLKACNTAKTHWVQAISRKPEGVDEYLIQYAENQDAFPEPAWSTQKLEKLIVVTFAGRMIENENHPGLLRLRGARQSMS